MPIGILGRKVGMTQIYDEAGRAVPVTVILAGPCHVLQVRTLERDKYEAAQFGFLDRDRERTSRSLRGHVAAIGSKRAKARAAAGVAVVPKANCEPKRFVREIRGPLMSITTGEGEEAKSRPVQVGDVIDVGAMAAVKRVDVTGTSVGRGYTGVMRRHNFKGQRATHGVKKCHRHGGSFGCRTFPGRTFKGKRMAGQYGNARTTMRNLAVVKCDPASNILLLRGGVPGPIGGLLLIKETNKRYRKLRGKPPVSKKKK